MCQEKNLSVTFARMAVEGARFFMISSKMKIFFIFNLSIHKACANCPILYIRLGTVPSQAIL